MASNADRAATLVRALEVGASFREHWHEGELLAPLPLRRSEPR